MYRLKDIKSFLYQNGFNISISLIHLILKNKMKFSFKKITNKYFYKNQDSINQKIEIFKKKIRRIPLKDIVSFSLYSEIL